MCDREERIKELERKVEELEKRIRGRRMYKSPIEITRTVDDIVTKMNEAQDEYITHACMSIGVNVDKDELVKALAYDRHQYEKGYVDGHMDGLNEHRWIPVDERLPEEGDEVLVTVEGWDNGKLFERDVDYAWVNPMGGYIGCFDTVNDWIEYGEWKVTAWMPIPKPYGGFRI